MGARKNFIDAKALGVVIPDNVYKSKRRSLCYPIPRPFLLRSKEAFIYISF